MPATGTAPSLTPVRAGSARPITVACSQMETCAAYQAAVSYDRKTPTSRFSPITALSTGTRWASCAHVRSEIRPPGSATRARPERVRSSDVERILGEDRQPLYYVTTTNGKVIMLKIRKDE